MAAKPEDALYAWMIPYYAIVARRNAPALLGNPDSAWHALKQKINDRSWAYTPLCLTKYSPAARPMMP